MKERTKLRGIVETQAKAVIEAIVEGDIEEVGYYGSEIEDAIADAIMAVLRAQRTTNDYRDENG